MYSRDFTLRMYLYASSRFPRVTSWVQGELNFVIWAVQIYQNLHNKKSLLSIPVYFFATRGQMICILITPTNRHLIKKNWGSPLRFIAYVPVCKYTFFFLQNHISERIGASPPIQPSWQPLSTMAVDDDNLNTISSPQQLRYSSHSQNPKRFNNIHIHSVQYLIMKRKYNI